MVNFDFLEKGLGKVSPPDCSKKNVSHVIFYYLIKLGKVCIAIFCYPGCEIMNFEINLIFLIKPFFSMTKKLRQKFKYLKNKKSF